ncbi:hypothetical protein P775_01800 [Puniceibacterium antarcticum]|uniref:GNAT family acetyltransferase n=1 Tax=Puniceibacterium antarcticum TaxID=1206336 RepID=A0A2G8RK59_9RHOB|nr:DUF2798 domain-containing protein [Puniceibacterium antarcticum]PIL21949.1 hypothetical protein P775_01800 [Puniceibacterium antarcticum]
MIPPRLAPVVFGFLLSGMMSFLVSGVATLHALGLIEGFCGLWISAWLPAWGIAFPAVLVVAPVARRLVAAMTRKDETLRDRPSPDRPN